MFTRLHELWNPTVTRMTCCSRGLPALAPPIKGSFAFKYSTLHAIPSCPIVITNVINKNTVTLPRAVKGKNSLILERIHRRRQRIKKFQCSSPWSRRENASIKSVIRIQRQYHRFGEPIIFSNITELESY